MPKVPDLLSSLGVAEDGISTVYPETFAMDIQSAYDEDFSIPSARISVLEADLAAAQAEILELKAHNYELMVSAPAAESAEGGEDEEQSEDESTDDNSDDNSGVDSLFREKE